MGWYRDLFTDYYSKKHAKDLGITYRDYCIIRDYFKLNPPPQDEPLSNHILHEILNKIAELTQVEK